MEQLLTYKKNVFGYLLFKWGFMKIVHYSLNKNRARDQQLRMADINIFIIIIYKYIFIYMHNIICVHKNTIRV